MPELIEVEMYRAAALATVGRRVAAVHAPDAWYLKAGSTAAAITDGLRGAVVVDVDRHGKLMLVSFDRGVELGLRFGMTGRLVVDGHAPITELIYGSPRREPQWDRFGLTFTDGGSLVISDPRRLGGVELSPDRSRLGPDAATISTADLGAALAGAHRPLKAVLLDQHRVAGLGNLLVDETLWRAGLAPHVEAAALERSDVRKLAGRIRSTIALLSRRGGSHTGDLQPERHRDGHCPRCGSHLRREVIATRTTYWCPVDQA